jgi:hypothetical protein
VVIADALSTVGQVASLVAAGAAVVVIYFAKQTVSETEQARSQASAAHVEQMAEARRLLEATAAAHQSEMAARERDFAAERVVQRLTHLRVITDVLRELTDIARDEQTNPPLRTEINQPLSRIPSRLAQLGTALSIYQRLGGPEMKQAAELARAGYNLGTPLMEVLGKAQGALSEAVAQADAHVALEPPALGPSRGPGG